ncbi:hypothetical protein J2T57_002848 [Natronocella acetinitrilica]|uniref:Uncharacterized protein n=1 Tax=Natronocella acetinitrilica TaxID=414046 RepID=A0AAE3G5W2_9GAMM|nr:hypothetical protein [Natronocella acetinitrilica]
MLDQLAEPIKHARSAGLPYRQLRSMISECLGVEVSEQTLRKYCQETLGLEPRVQRKGTVEPAPGGSARKLDGLRRECHAD